MFVELIESTLTKYQWRRTKYRHESGKVLEILLPPCYKKKGHGLTFNEAAEAKMLLTIMERICLTSRSSGRLYRCPKCGDRILKPGHCHNPHCPDRRR